MKRVLNISFFITLYIIAISLLNCCENKTAKNKTIDSIKTDTDSTISKISSFLFLKKGMTFEDVKEYLNKNSIKFSNPRKVINCPRSEQDLNQFEIGDESYIDIFNYQIGNIVLDSFRLFFIEDKLYRFKYYKNYSIQKVKLNSKDLDNIEEFHDKQNLIFSQFYYGLQEKYGDPKKFPNDFFSYSIQVGTFMFDREPTRTDSNGIFILGERYIKDVDEKFLCFWNSWFGSMPENLISSDYISIAIRIDLKKNKYYNKHYYNESRLMIVEFTSNEINSFIRSYHSNLEKPKIKKEDSINRLKRKFNESL